MLFDCAAGYGLGGSTVAMFGRVGGGIYTKAAPWPQIVAVDCSNESIVYPLVGTNIAMENHHF